MTAPCSTSVLGKLRQAAWIIVLASALAGCGGGEDGARQTAGGELRQAASATGAEELPQALSVVGLEKVSEVRVGRTIFDYTFRVSIRNDGQARGDVVAQIVGAGTGTTIRDGMANVLLIEGGATAFAVDTITLRHNRAYPFNPAALQWSITSTPAVVISGFVIDDPVAGADVEVTSLSTLAVIASVRTDDSGRYTTPSLPQSLLGNGYSIVATNGTINGEPFEGTLKAVYGLPSDYAESHLTFLTTAAAIVAESKGAGPADLAATVEMIGNDAAARGFFPDEWKDIDVATQFSTANSTVVALDGPVSFVDALVALLKGPAAPADGSTSCGPGEIAGEYVCRARIGSAGGKVYSQSGVATGDVLATFSPMAGTLLESAVEAVITLSEGGNVLNFSLTAARDLNSLAKGETKSMLDSGTLFVSPPQFTLPPPDFVTSLNVEQACASPDHADMPSSECLTRASGIKPAVFVLDGRVYLGIKNYHRVPSGDGYTHATTATDGGIYRRFGATLKGSRDRASVRHPVLFVHGYQIRDEAVGSFGGGDGTWGTFPQLVGEVVDPQGVLLTLFDRYEFQWRTNTSFYTAASDLANAIRHLHAQHGGKKIHIIAHSFGGLLARTTLQNLNGNDADIGGMIQSVTTLGTPHSGIRDGATPDTGIVLPVGWDTLAPGATCGQLSCFEAGLQANIPDWIVDAHKAQTGGVALGGLIVRLRESVDSLRDGQKILTLIGTGFSHLLNPYTATSGDYLITIDGQRFLPDSPGCSSEIGFLHAEKLGGALVSERVLGLSPKHCVKVGLSLDSNSLTNYATRGGKPGADNAYFGYAHNEIMGDLGTLSEDIDPANEAEIPIGCGSADSCIHDSWVSTKALLLSFHGGGPSPDFADGPTTVSAASCTPPVVGVPMTCTVLGANLTDSIVFNATNCSPAPMTALPGGDATQRQFNCTPLFEGVAVEVSYEVPGFIGALPSISARLAVAPTPIYGSFTDDFDGTALSTVLWSPVVGTGGISLSGGEVTFGARSGASTEGKQLITGTKIVIETRMAGKGSNRDTAVGIVNVASGGVIEVGDSTYRSWGFYAIGYGGYELSDSPFLIPHGSGLVGALGQSTADFLEYRITIEGDKLTIERGPTLDSIEQTATFTLAKSIAGAVFYVSIRTGDENYSPGTFDWIRVRSDGSIERLNDTGITADQCYRAGSDELVSCSSAEAIALNAEQDGMVGRDVTANDDSDGKAGFSFSLVPKPGGGFYDKTECVKDNVTGRMWEGKTNDGGLRDGSRRYTNYGDGRVGDASAYVAAVNAAGLCGHSDWRLPDRDELQGIVDYGVSYPGPTIDAAWFPNTRRGAYWTSSPLAGNPGYAWLVYFGYGYVNYYDLRNDTLHVRLVR